MTIVKYPILDIIGDYPSIYSRVFGEFTWTDNTPAEVYVAKEGEEEIGFLSGYSTAPGVWFLLRAGFNKELQGRVTNLKKYLEALEIVHNEYPCILTRVCNNDIKPLKMDLNAGFRIIGIRQGTSGDLYLELIHKKEN